MIWGRLFGGLDQVALAVKAFKDILPVENGWDKLRRQSGFSEHSHIGVRRESYKASCCWRQAQRPGGLIGELILCTEKYTLPVRNTAARGQHSLRLTLLLFV